MEAFNQPQEASGVPSETSDAHRNLRHAVGSILWGAGSCGGAPEVSAEPLKVAASRWKLPMAHRHLQ
jgi:hypothetical protein